LTPVSLLQFKISYFPLKIMNLSNALSLLLQNEAKRPSRETALLDTTLVNRNAENFPSNDTWWRTGALCIGMLNHNPSVTTVMIIVGAKEDKRYTCRRHGNVPTTPAKKSKTHQLSP
jgi:hypothetical protein